MRLNPGIVLPLICVLIAPAAGLAQQRDAIAFDNTAAISQPHFQEPQQGQQMKPEEEMGTSGFFLGLVGMLAGGAVGSKLGQDNCPSKSAGEACRNRHVYTGVLVAGSFFVPLGVHIASKQPHNFLKSLAVSAATGAVAYYGFKAIPGEPVALAPFVAAPIQVVTSVKLEGRPKKK